MLFILALSKKFPSVYNVKALRNSTVKKTAYF